MQLHIVYIDFYPPKIALISTSELGSRSRNALCEVFKARAFYWKNVSKFALLISNSQSVNPPKLNFLNGHSNEHTHVHRTVKWHYWNCSSGQRQVAMVSLSHSKFQIVGNPAGSLNLRVSRFAQWPKTLPRSKALLAKASGEHLISLA